MFRYRCPGCGKQHGKSIPYDQPFQAQCLRCRQSFLVTPELVQAQPPASPATGITTAPASTAPPRQTNEPLDADNVAEQPAPPRDKAPRKSPPGPTGPEGPRPPAAGGKRKLIAGIVAGVLLLGVGGYFLFGRGSKPKPPLRPQGTNSQASAGAPSRDADSKARKPGPKKQPGPAAPQPRNSEPIPLAAAHLSAQLAGEPAATNKVFDRALLALTGPFDRLAAPKFLPPPPVKPGTPAAQVPAPSYLPHRAYFLVAGRPVFCELSSAPAALRPWSALRKGEPITVHGIHVKDGLLRDCSLRALAAVADERYRGREVDVAGVIDAILTPAGRGVAFPTVRLEGETFGKVAIECLFRKEDEAQVGQLQVGSPVTIRGTCNGRQPAGSAGWIVRLDNCRVETTTGAAGGVPRLPAPALARAYEDDLRTAPFVEWGKEERLPGTLTVEQLDREARAGRKEMEATYRHRILTVSGRLLRRQDRQAVLESKNTDQPLQVVCHFDRHAFTALAGAGPNPVVRGLCTSVNERRLRLDNAEVLLPEESKRDPRRVTADFFPQAPGRILTYDVATFATTGKRQPRVERQRWFQLRERIETTITHTGRLAGAGLVDAADPGAWFRGPRTQAVRLPGPVYLVRLSPGFVEIGQRGANGMTLWAPLLKLGARTGDSWKWTRGPFEHVYSVTGFGERRGQQTLTIVEEVTSNLDDRQRWQVEHLYLRGVGVLQRREALLLPGREKRPVSELRLVRVQGEVVGPPGPKK